MIVLVCGSRMWRDRIPVVVSLARAYSQFSDSLIVIEGGNRKGADRIAYEWARDARSRGVGLVHSPAEWNVHDPDWCPGDWCLRKNYCTGAGARRNQSMLDYVLTDGHEAKILAFKNPFDRTFSKGGTEDMVKRGLTAGLPCFLYEHDWEKLN